MSWSASRRSATAELNMAAPEGLPGTRGGAAGHRRRMSLSENHGRKRKDQNYEI
jgi:hypothetical protein